MPQLNPAPWFMIMAASWVILLILMGPKVITTTSQAQPTALDQAPQKTSPWNWPWT